MRACCVQLAHGDSLAQNVERAAARLREAADARAELALLPEYWFATGPGGDPADAANAVRGLYREQSRALGIVVAGNVVERQDGALLNVGVVYDAGRSVLEQPKIHPMPREVQAGVQGGASLRAGKVRAIDVGMLVCADILFPEAARVLALQGAQVLLNPVMSPYRERDNTKQARDAIFIARAYDSGAFVLKAGGFRVPSGGKGVAGRSLIAAPWGIVAHYTDDFKEEMLYAELDMARLAGFREHQRSAFPARRPHAYDGLL